jgi:hypothetical protein
MITTRNFPTDLGYIVRFIQHARDLDPLRDFIVVRLRAHPASTPQTLLRLARKAAAAAA